MSFNDTTAIDQVNNKTIPEKQNSTVKVRIRYQFAPVPRDLAQNPEISARTLGVITYLCSKGENWEPRVFDIKKRFKFSDRAWRDVSTEMRALNIMGLKKTRHGTSLLFDPMGIESEDQVIHKPPVQNEQVAPTCTPSTCAQRTDLDHIDPILDRSYDDHIDHRAYDFKNKNLEPASKKPSIASLEALLTFEEQCIYEKLISFKKMQKRVALSIIATNQQNEIHAVLEAVKKDGVLNPGAYINRSLYRKQA